MAINLLLSWPNLTAVAKLINLVSESCMDAFSNAWPSSCKLDPRLQVANWKSQWNSGDRKDKT